MGVKWLTLTGVTAGVRGLRATCNELWMSLALQIFYSAWIRCEYVSAHLEDMTEPFYFCPVLKSCTACWPSPWGAFIENHSTVKIANHRSLYALQWLMWLSGQRKQKALWKAIFSHLWLFNPGCQSHPSLRFLLTWQFSMRERERLDGVMLYCSVPTVQWERPANTWSWYHNVIKPLIKH